MGTAAAIYCIIYCRISDDPKDEHEGVDLQEKKCRELAAKLGWIVLYVLIDNDLSAMSKKRRPAFEQLLVDLADGRANAVLAWHNDRLVRFRRTRSGLMDLERFIDVVNAHGVQVRTVKAGEMDLATATGRANARTAAVWAGHEVEHGIERMRESKAEKAEQGKYRGGPRNFGYEKDGTTVRESEARELRAAATRVLAGESVSSIVRDWTTRGIGTPRNGAWRVNSIRGILTKPRNAALVDHEGSEYRAQWPAILTEAEYRALRALFADPSRHTGGSRGSHEWLGSGMYLCGNCDDGTTIKIGGRGKYRCKLHYHLSRRAEPVDLYVEELLLGKDGRAGILTRPETKLRLRDVPEVDMAAMQAEAVAIREEMDGLARERGKREITSREYRLMVEPMKADLDALESRLVAAASVSPLAGIVDAVDVRVAWRSAGVSRQRAVLASLATVVLLPASVGRQPGGGYFDESSVRIEPIDP